jgi:hypothetical protein
VDAVYHAYSNLKYLIPEFSYLDYKDGVRIATDTNNVAIFDDLESHDQIVYPQAKH